MARNHTEREKIYKEAGAKNIVEVAENLGLELVKVGRVYQTKEHDSLVITPRRNEFYWNSQGFGGGPIQLVKAFKSCSQKEAIEFLTGIEIGAFDRKSIPAPKEFHYTFKEHKTFDLSREYLKNERKLTDQTIDFFFNQGLLAQISYKDYETGKTEPVIVFKGIDKSGSIKGIAVQGIWENKKHGKRKYLKRTHGSGYHGFVVRVGNPPAANQATTEKPLIFIAFEAPIDLMSYYELFQDKIGDAILLCMNGLHKENISLALANELGAKGPIDKRVELLDLFENNVVPTDVWKIILACDNDEAGRKFVNDFGITKYPVVAHLPKLAEGQSKADWNEVLQTIKKPQQNAFEKRIDEAKVEKKNRQRISKIAKAGNASQDNRINRIVKSR